MRPRTRATGVLLAAVLLAPTALVGAPGTALAKPGKIAAQPGKLGKTSDEPTTVTLITGDKVTVSGSDRTRIEPGPGRRNIKFVASRTDGHLSVVPTDVLPLLQADRVDRRLFDITALIEFGYDDKRADLPLIVTGSVASARSAGVVGVRALPGGAAMKVAKSGIGAVWQGLSAGVRAEGAARGGSASKIWLDGKRKPLLKESVPQIGAPTAWEAGFDGTGVKVAVVDSGIDSDHPDLAGRVVAAQNFTEGESDTLDRVGHGTHVAATIASTGAAPGGYKGVAPGASLLSAKVCGVSDCSDSSIIAGMQWAAEQGAKVANVSLGGGDTPGQDPVEAAVERITAEFGMLFVIAAGNTPRDSSIGSPGSTDAALTVGAVDKADNLADFSSRGPRRGDSALKPDITGPGVDITAALSSDAEGAPPGTTHVSASGTSMATPHVVGSAAILAQQHPTWSPAQLKAALMASAKPNADIAIYSQGAGRVDAARAITQTVTSSPASVSFGLQKWPHADDTADARTVTYRNTGTAEVTLDLRLTGTMPAGLFSLSANTVTVPAGGTASVTLTSDTRANVADGRHGGHLVATAGNARVVTPFAVDKESESYDVTVNRIDRAGQPTTNGYAVLINLDNGAPVELESLEDPFVARVPKGRYGVVGGVYDLEAADFSQVVDASFTVDRPSTLTIDARVAKPLSVSVPAADAVTAVASIETSISDQAEWSAGFLLFDLSFKGMYVGQVDPAEREPKLNTAIASQLVKGPIPDEGPLVTPSPYAYFLSKTFPGHMPSGFAARYAERDLARVENTYASQGISTGSTSTAGFVDTGGFPVSRVMPIALPGQRTDYFSTDPLVSWVRDVYEGDWLDPYSVHMSPRTKFQAGRTTSERVNAAVFGPALTAGGILRYRNEMLAEVPMFSGAGNWIGLSNATGRTVVTRDGQVIYDEPTVGAYLPTVAPGDAAFTVKIDANRPAPNKLSTTVSTEWTFRSATAPGEEILALPASAVRFAPPLSITNTAPAGKVWLVPVEVQRQPDSAAGRVRTLTVEVSFDDGATWRSAPVIRNGQQGVVFLKYPAKAGFVSLRTASKDASGNTVKQTIIRAYEIA